MPHSQVVVAHTIAPTLTAKPITSSNERLVDPAYTIGRTNLAPEPSSRLADTTNPDRPPKPPDDPAAALFMANPGGFRGAHGWEKDGLIDSIEPEGWEANLPKNQNGVVLLSGESATDIALANSREYQSRLEAVYLAALGLTLNRFEFATQWFSRNGVTYEHAGASSLPTETNTLTVARSLGFNRAFAAGGQLLVDFANTFVWEFTGTGVRTGRGNLAITLVQPLLRNFGRKVRLENLTQAERDVLYSVREFARFRKLFWANVNVDSGGYLQLLRQVQAVRNARANLQAQEENYALYRKLYQGGRTQIVNVDQVYQALLGARSAVISAEIGLQDQLDAFKLRLGLPPRLEVELDDMPLKQFQFVDPATEKLREEIEQFDRARRAELDSPPNADALRAHFDTLETFRTRVATSIDTAERALKAWESELQKPGEDKEQLDRANEAYDLLKSKPTDLRVELKAVAEKIAQKKAIVREQNREELWSETLALSKDIATVLDGTITVESQARIYTVALPDIDVTENEGLTFAKANRLDLQNALAQVTDTWRRVSVTTNALQGDLNVRLDANLGSDPASRNPFDFSAEASRYAIGLQFDGPLTRQAERNAYRASLIFYQQARRRYMALSDQVEFDVRSGLRTLRQQRINFEIARQQLLVATRQLAIERRNLTAPVTQQNQRRDEDSATLRILQAQQQLLDARNRLADNFFGYEQQRVGAF